MGALGGVGMLLPLLQLLASASPLSKAIPPQLTQTHTHTDTRGGILALVKGPHGKEKIAPSRQQRHRGWLALLSRSVNVYAHTQTQRYTNTDTHRFTDVAAYTHSHAQSQASPGGVVLTEWWIE